MSNPGGINPLLLASQDTQYTVSRSLRFNSSDSAYLSRTPSSAGNRKTFTLSLWIKRTALSAATNNEDFVFEAYSSSTNRDSLFYTGSDQLNLNSYQGGSFASNLSTVAVYRDFAAWQHVVVSVDTTQATSTNRVKIYVNGTEAALTGTYPTQNLDYILNNSVIHRFSGSSLASGYFLNAYLADIHFIDGQALTPSSFTEVSATTGQLVPKQYSGSYGTNGFRLDFADNSAATAAALGKDSSPNGNNWTPNNLSVTAGAGNDSLVDTPTSYGTDTGAGGEVRGNYCTWNPLAKLGDITQTLNVSNGNLTFSGSSNIGTIGTIGMSSGKWYWELNCTSLTASQLYFGMTSVTTGSRTASFVGIRDTGVLSGSANGATTNGSGTTAFATGDVVGFAYDADSKRLFVAKNNTWLNGSDPAAGTNASFTDVQGASLYPFISDNNTTATIDANFGQRSWIYAAPSGFKALCDTNLPSPQVAKPSTVFDTKLYTGNGSTQTVSGLGFSPDFVWVKKRNTAGNHFLADTVRGATKALLSDATDAEYTNANYITAFNSDGFSVGSDSGYNTSSHTYVAWTWDAGSSNSTNTQGSITSTVRANASAGFSIVTYTGNGTGTSWGHGLNVAPRFIIFKRRDSAANWRVLANVGVHSGFTHFEGLNTTAAGSDWTAIASASSTTVTIPNNADWNANNATYVAYCFAPVSGYSSAFSFSGNGSSDGPMVWLGFRARLILVKRTDTTGSWYLYDTARDTYNIVGKELMANRSDAEAAGSDMDILSNGFKMRTTGIDLNANGGTYVGFAWAENPFAYARAR